MRTATRSTSAASTMTSMYLTSPLTKFRTPSAPTPTPSPPSPSRRRTLNSCPHQWSATPCLVAARFTRVTKLTVLTLCISGFAGLCSASVERPALRPDCEPDQPGTPPPLDPIILRRTGRVRGLVAQGELEQAPRRARGQGREHGRSRWWRPGLDGVGCDDGRDQVQGEHGLPLKWVR